MESGNSFHMESGKLNIMFNSTGIEERIWDLITLNVKGVWFGCKYSIQAMHTSVDESIINTASSMAIMVAATPQLACTFLSKIL
ncbi:hypothetical protein BC936DRAFT_144439 [Jimgerdemannia flammicorona]|uniref:Uncharacterized protein n=1 Tax=Jimgerdemannia flammicorona TaxID=994334 RepID=A0A433DCF1_9FUNG|nr:hypothetical protein BC936DRAFT_144439 [Jimgerdemannia flammicorona]